MYVMNSDWFRLKWALHPELITHGFKSETSSLAAHAWCSRVVSAMVTSAHLMILAIMHTSSLLVTSSAIMAFTYLSGLFTMMFAMLCSTILLAWYASLSACDAVHP